MCTRQDQLFSQTKADFPTFALCLVDDYSRASRVMPLRAKYDAPVEFEKWATMMQDGTGEEDQIRHVRQCKGAGSGKDE